MKGSYIDPTAVVKNSELKEVKLFRNARIIDSVLGDGCSVGDDTAIERCQFENNVVINRRSYINDCMIRRYSYTGINTTMNWTKMGAFCSVARNVDIGGFDHDYRKITTMPAFRFEQMRNGGGALQNHATHEHCAIGNDVWIAAGATILHKVRVGDGAVIGAGAVVTHDIPPYAIAVGTPARVIGFRCKEDLIEDLLKVQWWSWPEETIRENMSMIIHEDISQETVQRLIEISNSISV